MSDIHVKTLAAYKNLGSVYSYGYGALRQAYQSFHDGNDSFDYYVKATQRIISAVEFRSAELLAERVIEEMASAEASQVSGSLGFQADSSAIYAVPSAADGIARDQ